MDAIVLKALVKDPDYRYQSAREFKNDITRVLAGEQATAVIPRPVPESEVPTRVVPVPPPDDEDIEDEPKKRGGLIALLVVLSLVLLGGVA